MGFKDDVKPGQKLKGYIEDFGIKLKMKKKNGCENYYVDYNLEALKDIEIE